MQLSIASSSLISIPIIEAILASEHTLGSIITNPDKPTGRGKKIEGNDLAKWAEEKGLAVAKPADTSELNRHLLASQPQLIVTCAYGRLIPVELLHGPRFGWVNLHFSLLPKLRGAAPVQWAILNGETSTGFTIFKLDKGMDTGPIYVSKEVNISDEDTTPILLKRLTEFAIPDLMELISVIGKTKATPQPLSGATLAPKISKDMARIDWTSSIETVLRQDRALSDNPGIWSTFNGERISLHGLVEVLVANNLKSPGDIELVGNQLLVRTSDSVLEVKEVTPSGKKRMSGADFARGARLEAGSKFE
ncbi:MAG: methionyl-tRNA formyltransferase [Actinobacteria bacterium]|uniref:methionyl-tRNA formyltransferase n=1 Tax=freshwater metagenome TaxID=449393 RepID=A0A6J7KCH8_9ZZZZ|nr:methionyl-tRNA formyltransferase [Actinomycetota bacterium]